VTSLVAAQLPRWAALPVTPVELDGWDNTTFRLGERMSCGTKICAEVSVVTQVYELRLG
jgi:aminoglycoside phosphotransferase (APT) family kinase protein